MQVEFQISQSFSQFRITPNILSKSKFLEIMCYLIEFYMLDYTGIKINYVMSYWRWKSKFFQLIMWHLIEAWSVSRLLYAVDSAQDSLFSVPFCSSRIKTINEKINIATLHGICTGFYLEGNDEFGYFFFYTEDTETWIFLRVH